MEKFTFTHDGYKRLITYQKALELRRLIVEITKKFPKNEFKLISQMKNSARSVKQNIVEGYQRGTINYFLNFLSISSGSAAELDEDLDDCLEDSLVDQEDYDKAKTLCRQTMYLIDRLMVKLRRVKNQ